MITDRWTGHGWWPLDRWQLCWAHLIREFQKITDRGDESQKIGEGLLIQAHKLFELWHRVRDGTLTREGFAAAVVKIRAAVRKSLTEGASYEAVRGNQSARARTARTCQELLKVEQAFWLFVRVAGIEPTNDAAERALRPAVIWRRISLGTRLGMLAVSPLLSTGIFRAKSCKPFRFEITFQVVSGRSRRSAASLWCGS